MRQCWTRAAVRTTARGRRVGGNATSDAGFSSTSPARNASFNAARSVARIRSNVAADNRRPAA
ncbi:hypothetical protein [Actinomadura coerulea]|uniref:hypothetical protein n=1 Tax=Actinomadura coerulea TaxID=46159 RepID=UPI00343BDC52